APGRAKTAATSTGEASVSATTTPGDPATTTTTPSGRLTTTTTTAAAVGGCPDPRGCPNYRLYGGRWPTDANGTTTIHYRLKTDGHTPSNTPPITPEQLIDANRRATETWMNAVPNLRLVYDGTTSEAPNSRNNVIGWGATTTVVPGGAETRFTPGPAGPTYAGFSVYLYPTQAFAYHPCDAIRGPCVDDSPALGHDLQGFLTHEWGHVLGLDHVNDQADTDELTMHSGGQRNYRHMASLGLGDVLGARNLYPTSAPIPTLYRP
ncbi:MAG: hypothetical protein M3422_26765, partial [Actinomycetota bacterium]|nr:hypothetical protein [Actinomycetota bacterium]